jgi:DNA-binding IclR family transcriptional regulator
MTTATDADAPTAMIDRVALILAAFNGTGFSHASACHASSSTGQLTLAQVVAQTGLPRSSTHRILEHLVKIRWLARADGGYSLGLAILELGGLAAHQNQLRAVAQPFLHELHASTGLVVHLAVRDGPEIVYLEKICGPFGMRVPSRIGGRQPAHCTAAGKALLAYADEPVRELALALAPQGRTCRSITTGHQLDAELRRVLDRGVAFDREEAVPGIGCVASPVGPPQDPCAAISVCGPVGQVSYDRLIGRVRGAASQAWAAYSAGRFPGPGRQPARASAAPPAAHAKP